jgi:hypothetical protein
LRYYKIQISGNSSPAPAASTTSGSATLGTVTGTIGGVTASVPGGAATNTTTPTPSSSPSTSFQSLPSLTAVASSASSSETIWESVVNGVNDPGALDVAFTIFSKASQSDAPNDAHIQIFGIPIQLVSQASQFTQKRIQVWAGYTNGLPLANEQVPHQGLILDGMIYPAWGNWISNNTSIEFVVQPLGSDQGQGGPTNVKNIVHNMPQGTSLGTAIQQALTTAFPNSTVNVNISSKLTLPAPDYSFHQSLDQYLAYAKALSHSILGTPSTTGYSGVTAHIQGNTINVNDGTVIGGTVQINYDDLVGQPTWIGLNEIQVTTVMRGDLGNFSGGTMQITLPPTLTTMTEANALNAATPGVNGLAGLSGNYLSFQGTWKVKGLRHIGRFRDPQWNAWVTVINAFQNSPGGGAGGNGSPDPSPSTGGVQIFTPSGGVPGTTGIGMN